MSRWRPGAGGNRLADGQFGAQGGSSRFANASLVGGMSVNGALRSGATAYNTGTGFWLEGNGGTPRLFVGTSGGNKMTWDGTTLSITGAITVMAGNAAKIDLTNVTGNYAGSPGVGGNANDTVAVNGTAAATISQGAGRANTAINSSNNVVTSVIPATAVGNPGAAGLYLGSDYLGYHNGNGLATGWRAYVDSSGNVLFGDPSGTRLQWAAGTGVLTIVSGGGNVTINADGITISQGTGDTNRVKWVNSGTTIGFVQGNTLATLNQIVVQATGKDSTVAAGKILLETWHYDLDANKTANLYLVSGASPAVTTDVAFSAAAISGTTVTASSQLKGPHLIRIPDSSLTAVINRASTANPQTWTSGDLRNTGGVPSTAKGVAGNIQLLGTAVAGDYCRIFSGDDTAVNAGHPLAVCNVTGYTASEFCVLTLSSGGTLKVYYAGTIGMTARFYPTHYWE